MANLMVEELSLLEVWNRLIDDENDYGAKINLLYDLFKANEQLPNGVTNTYDSPSLWPDNGINVYNIAETYGVSKMFCTTGVLVNFASLKYKFQLMLVKTNILDSTMDGKLFERHAETDTAGTYVWTDWAGLGASGLTGNIKVTLEGDISGQGTINSSGEIKVNTSTNNKLLPVNFSLLPKNYTVKTYYKLCTLPAPSNTGHNYVTIQGHIGSRESNKCKAFVNITASNSAGPVVYGVVFGKLSSDIDMFALSNLNNELEIYLSVFRQTDTCDLSITGAEAEKGNSSSVKTPLGITRWTLSQDAAVITNKATNTSVSEDASNIIAQLQLKNQALESQVDSLSDEVLALKDRIFAVEIQNNNQVNSSVIRNIDIS